MFKESPKIPPHYCYRCPYGLKYPDCNIRCAHELENLIQREGSDNIAAFIAEPVVGSTVGALVPPDEYWPLIRDICTRNDILLIADEVMTGMGRTGRAFCVNHWGVTPDILVSAKGMAAGYAPAGGVFLKDEIAEAIKCGSGFFRHSYTYNGNPVSCAAITAVVKYMKKHNLIENADIQGEFLGEELIRHLSSNPIVGDIRGKGLMWGLELVADRESKKAFTSSLKASARVADECMKRGLVVYPGSGMINGVAGDNLMIAPPLIVDKDQIIEIVSILEKSVEAASDYLLSAEVKWGKK
jgi:adenosylmethionine-8-amino-7-oxononanoate aminotransferase